MSLKMKSGIRISMVIFLMILSADVLVGQRPYHTSLTVDAPDTVMGVIISGKTVVYYELKLANFNQAAVELTSVEVLGSDGIMPVSTFTETDLTDRINPIVNQKEPGTTLLPGKQSILYLEFPLEDKGITGCSHRIGYRLAGEAAKSGKHFIRGAEVVLENRSPVEFGQPLSGGPWAAVYDPSWQRGHRRVLYTENGKARIPGRFAIDFIKLDTNGAYTSGDKDLVENWHGYNAEILAVADGVVAGMRDDFQESLTLAEHPLYSADMASGNYVSLDIGGGRFVFYEHLKPGSVRVVKGQQVRKGDSIAALGFTGQSTGPHLHLHLADKNSPLGAEGVPFVFESFELLGSYTNFEDFGKKKWEPAAGILHLTGERPAPNSVIQFQHR
jgi:hypothetical protein